MSSAGQSIPRSEIVWSTTSLMSPRTTVGPYTPDFWVIVWLITGRGSITCDGRTRSLRPGSVHVSPPGWPIHIASDRELTVRVGSLHFRLDGVPDLPRFRAFPPNHFVPGLLNHVLWLSAERPEDWAEARHEAFRCALRAFVRGHTAIDPLEDSQLSEPLARVVAHVQVGWGSLPLEAHSLEELAAAAGVTKSHLCRLFERETGMGPVGAFRMLRLERAAALLQSRQSVISIAQKVGYSSEFHFSRAFKAATGSSPSAFRADPRRQFELPPGLRVLSQRLWHQIRDVDVAAM